MKSYNEIKEELLKCTALRNQYRRSDTPAATKLDGYILGLEYCLGLHEFAEDAKENLIASWRKTRR